ncbi:MAG: hypothetical protein GWP04_09790 [Gammaproteobacteria bacterium]|nr:hypothetical protein [Gammaproteobacteria bacterium]
MSEAVEEGQSVSHRESETTTELDEPRSLFRHPLAAVGGALIVAGMLGFAILAFVDLSSTSENPYRGIVTFIGFPSVVMLGMVLFLLAIRIQVVKARRRGEHIRFNLRFEASNPRYIRSLALFIVLTVLLLGTVAWGGYKGYEVTDSPSFCGEACHTVMNPQWVTYQESPHARVACAECHIGPGASFFVRAKIDGIRQVVAVLTNSYERPIPTPVTSLRPAQQTCEGCHWPDQFYGEKLITKTYYRTDEANSPWTISLLMKVGGGNPRTGEQEGIHWHMLSENKIEYVPIDEKRQEIAWVRTTNSKTGEVTVFKRPDVEIDLDSPETEIRVLDCMDCHNRPSHDFLAPATAINLEMSKGTISSDLPFIRWQGLILLNAPYETKPEADEAIRSGLLAYYASQYPGKVDQSMVEQAADALVRIYDSNFFPEMKTDYRAREDNLSHFVNNGCFRCHFSDLETDDGAVVTSTCESCHTIAAQGPSDDLADIENSVAGLDFQHPVNIGEAWKEIKCTQCHTPAQGY